MNDVNSAIDKQELASSDLLDLTPQQRNLLLIRPLLKLDFTKLSYADDDGAYLLEDIDTNYLCLAALTFMMEGAAIQVGYTKSEVLEHLIMVVGRMQVGLSAQQCRRIADIVLDTLSNASNNYVEHRDTYFHAPSGETRSFSFRLIKFEADTENAYRYTPTQEGYLVLMGMLDLEVEDYQLLIEKMLQLLIERGKFDQALEFANRARTLSIEHRQQLRDFIMQAARSPGSVPWATVISPRLNDARNHVRQRQDEDRRMKEAVDNQVRQIESITARDPLIKLHKVLESAGTQRAKLQTDITTAGSDFLNAQATGFRARRPSGLPDLETQLLPSYMQCPASQIAASADDLLVSLYPAVFPKTPDLSNYIAVMMERRASFTYEDDDDNEAEIEPFREYPDPFPEDLIRRVHAWLDLKLSLGHSRRLDELLEAASCEGMTLLEQQAAAYELYRSFADSESKFPHLHAVADGEYVSTVVSGDNLRFDPVKEHLDDKQ